MEESRRVIDENLLGSVRQAIEISRRLRRQLAETRREFHEQRLQRELARLSEMLARAEGELNHLTAIEPDPPAQRLPSLNRWLENVE